ncbi:MAG: ABC transporter ATP-binding protein [Pseudorhodoplanes sp.]
MRLRQTEGHLTGRISKTMMKLSGDQENAAHDGVLESVLELKNIRRTYGATVAVDQVDLTVKRGEFLTFLGPSGSGKTTTLMMVAGLLQPTSGEILLNGKPLDPLPPYRRNIGMVFQQYALFPHMTVNGNVSFPLEMRNMSKAEIRRKVADALKLVGLPDHGDRYPSQLSGGQQQRVALARAIVFQPPLLLMDEPLGALDKKLRDQMQIEISRLHRELGISVLYVTHDQEEALVMSDRIAVFDRGHIEQIGRPKELYERPRTRFVADFIGSSSFLPGIVREANGDYAVVETEAGALRGFNSGGLSAGSKAVMTVRPERVSIGTRQPDSSVNALDGRVRDVIYLGQACKIVINWGSGRELIALQQASSFGERDVEPGAQVTAQWSAVDCNVLPSEA